MLNTPVAHNVAPKVVEISKEQAIDLIKAVVLCFGTQSFVLSGCLAHRSMNNIDEISRFMFDELEAGVKVALSMAVKPAPPYASVVALTCEVRRDIGELQGPIWFKIGNGSHHKFDPNAPL